LPSATEILCFKIEHVEHEAMISRYTQKNGYKLEPECETI